MAIDRPEKLGDGFVEWGEGRRLSMPAFVGLTRAVLDKGRSMRFRAKGKSMTPLKRGTLSISPASVKAGLSPLSIGS